MFQISVEKEFCAAHALAIAGAAGPGGREPLHGHNFHLTVTLQGERLDADGLLLDFHALERLINDIVHPLHNQNLNDKLPFNPSAELIAKHLADRITAGLPSITPKGAPVPRLAAVRLTEAPGCAVTYTP
ncbi:MAG TPA: 6-carboxytetrahydropterin synthase [Phycisphaerales bacterium]|nr:6-carboxytetrahydropterin synthase [Phycisphaerales bacterium]